MLIKNSKKGNSILLSLLSLHSPPGEIYVCCSLVQAWRKDARELTAGVCTCAGNDFFFYSFTLKTTKLAGCWRGHKPVPVNNFTKCCAARCSEWLPICTVIVTAVTDEVSFTRIVSRGWETHWPTGGSHKIIQTSFFTIRVLLQSFPKMYQTIICDINKLFIQCILFGQPINSLDYGKFLDCP